MDNSLKKQLLDSILNSPKLRKKYETLRYKYKLNRKLLAKKIILESDLLFSKLKNINKVFKFFESYFVNHINDFLILRDNDRDNFSKDTNNTKYSINENNLPLEENFEISDLRVDVNPNDRLKKEIEERKMNNINIQLNEDNFEEKNESDYLENTMNMNKITYNPYLNTQQQPMMNQQQPMMNQQQPMMNQQQPMMNQQQPMINQQQPMMNQQQPMMNQQQPMMNQQQPIAPQQTNNNYLKRQQPLLAQQQPLLAQQQPLLAQQQPLLPQQQPLLPQQQPLLAQQQQPILAQQQQPILPQQQQQQQKKQPIEEKMTKSLIHIDSRERDLVLGLSSNPLNILMNNSITCLVNVRDLIINNIYNDAYLLVQIIESNKGVYENQLGKEVHFKLFRTETNRENSVYKNLDLETMIRLRNVEKISFNVLRPNGQSLYSNIRDINDIFVESKERTEEFIQSSNVISNYNEKVLLLLVENLNQLMLQEGDTISLFNRDLEESDEYKIIYLSKNENKLLVECVENRKVQQYSKLLINKYQISITLEII